MPAFTVHQNPHHLRLEFFAPASGNALGLDVARELTALQQEFRLFNKPVVVTSSHPRLFCSGGNLTDYQGLKSKAAGLKINREIQKHLTHFARWPVVKLAVLEGDVLGGGLEWLAGFDWRWSTPAVLMSFWQRRIGLSPGWGGGKAWAAKIGENRLRGLILAGELLSAERAQHHGLIDRILTPWMVPQAIEEWSENCDQPVVQRLTRWTSSKEKEIFTGLWQGPVHRAALSRWKKPPKT